MTDIKKNLNQLLSAIACSQSEALAKLLSPGETPPAETISFIKDRVQQIAQAADEALVDLDIIEAAVQNMKENVDNG